jgi:hypothetical protein
MAFGVQLRAVSQCCRVIRPKAGEVDSENGVLELAPEASLGWQVSGLFDDFGNLAANGLSRRAALENNPAQDVHFAGSVISHALAIFQSRITLCGEIFSTSAVSSTLRPPKKT